MSAAATTGSMPRCYEANAIESSAGDAPRVSDRASLTPRLKAEGQAAWTRLSCYRGANNGCGNMATNVDAASD